MRSETLALYATIYPGVEPYLPEWYRSIERQSDRDFDLWIGLDSLRPADVAAAIGTAPDAQWSPSAPGASPARIRGDAMQRLTTSYGAIVFVDSDDTLHPTRVAAARAGLARADVVGCALELMDRDGRDCGVVFQAPDRVDPVALLPRYNVFGMSNTAYQSAVLRQCLPVGDECALVDWLLATRAWALGATIEFDPTPRMRYRQYHDNIAPVLPPFSAAQVLAATRRVLGHYHCALESAWTLPEMHRIALEAERTRVTAFDTAMRHDQRRLDTYVEQLAALTPMRVWWWQVANPELEAIWTN